MQKKYTREDAETSKGFHSVDSINLGLHSFTYSQYVCKCIRINLTYFVKWHKGFSYSENCLFPQFTLLKKILFLLSTQKFFFFVLPILLVFVNFTDLRAFNLHPPG